MKEVAEVQISKDQAEEFMWQSYLWGVFYAAMREEGWS